MSDQIAKVLVRERNKLDRQHEAVATTEAHIDALEQLEIQFDVVKVTSKK